MKIVTPLTNVDCYEPLMEAGADEFYCGIVPYEWLKKYNNTMPINRREFIYTGNICNMSSMEILKKKVDRYNIPVKITFNYLFYHEEQYELILDIMNQLIDIGFNTFIIADVALIIYLRQNGVKCDIHLSGEAAENNELTINFLNQFDISRYVFTRKNRLEDMKACISGCNKIGLEFEAFIVNGLCTYSSSYCNTHHCEELSSACFIPYDIVSSDKKSKFRSALRIIKISNTVGTRDFDNSINDRFGATGCGICRIRDLYNMGVTHLKVVGRGSSLDTLVNDVKNTKKIINEALQSNNNDFSSYVIEKYRNNKCPAACLYPKPL